MDLSEGISKGKLLQFINSLVGGSVSSPKQFLVLKSHMAQRSAVPKFGNWENGDNVPYTVYFKKARRSRNKGHKIHLDPARPQYQHHEIDLSRKSLDPPLQTDDAIGQGNGADTLGAKHRPTDSPISEPPARVSSGKINRRRNGIFGASTELSDGSRGFGVSQRERKGSFEVATGKAPATPGRWRLRSADDFVVPKFGEWDENNPASADGYTLIFNNVQQRRNGGSAKSLSSSSSSLSNQNSPTAQHMNPTSKSVSCFCWS